MGNASDSDADGSKYNIILNPNFNAGSQEWSASWSCSLSVTRSNGIKSLKSPKKSYGIISKRTQPWQGIEQDITSRLQPNIKYNVAAVVAIKGSSQAEDVIATVKLENSGRSTKYVQIGRTTVSDSVWAKIEGSFIVQVIPEKAVFYLEGPSAGIDILVDSVCINPEGRCTNSERSCDADSDFQMKQEQCFKESNSAEPTDGHKVESAVNDLASRNQNCPIIENYNFADGLKGWSGRCCTISLCEERNEYEVFPHKGKYFAATSGRKECWQGLEQDITGRLKGSTLYDVHAMVRIHGGSDSSEVAATLYVEDLNAHYISLGRVNASESQWNTLQGEFCLPCVPKKAVAYLEGPPAGVDILVDNFSITVAEKKKLQEHISPPPPPEGLKFGINIIENSSYLHGLASWYPLGSCSLRLGSGAPRISAPAAIDSLELHDFFSGKFIIATDRKFRWEGPAQTITSKLDMFLPYQVSAWVRIGSGGIGMQKVNVALSVDGKWVTGGEVEGSEDHWIEIKGSFRLETKPEHVFVHVQGPSPGVDLMLANLQIFPVNRLARIPKLKDQADKIRKRDVVLQVSSASYPVFLQVDQMTNHFSLGACLNRHSLQNNNYTEFFLKHFNFAVFENELKWEWTEPNRGQYNYKDADELCEFCHRHNIPIRGHCILWECRPQGWLKALSKCELEEAVQNRVFDLVSRYQGKFKHFDVNNEMLHGDFFKSKLGTNFLPYLFQLVHQFDPSAVLFVNDYHVEDGCDAESSPEKYIEHIEELLSQGAPVGGVGLQSHLDTPIGPIVCQALDKLAMLGLPIWLTEVDVSSGNEVLRADDLEVVLWEAYAHPAVEGIMLWGFWQGACRRNGHLLNADYTLNEAGRRLVAIKEEWNSSFTGWTDDKGILAFRGCYGSYTVRIDTPHGHFQQSFEIKEGDGPLSIQLNI